MSRAQWARSVVVVIVVVGILVLASCAGRGPGGAFAPPALRGYELLALAEAGQHTISPGFVTTSS